MGEAPTALGAGGREQKQRPAFPHAADLSSIRPERLNRLAIPIISVRHIFSFMYEKIDADSVGIPVACEASSLPFHYFATNDLIESAHVPLCELAQEQWACFSSQRVADGTAVHVRSPRSWKCLLPCNLDRRPGSCLIVDGHWRCWPDLLARSLVCSEYRRRLSRSHPLSGGISLPLLLPAVPQRRRAPLPPAVSRAR